MTDKTKDLFQRTLLFVVVAGQSLLVFPGSLFTYSHLSILNPNLLRTRVHICTALGLLGFLIFLLFVPTLNLKDQSLAEFFKSFLNILLFFLSVSSILNIREKLKNYVDILKIIAKLSAFYALLQIIFIILLKDDIFYFLLNPISISTASDIARFEAVNLLGYYRPYSFYHEPSYLALIANILFVKIYMMTNRICLYSLFCVIVSISIVGYITLIFTLFLICKRRYKFFFIVLVFFITFMYSDFFRFGEVFREGTSGYERIGVIAGTLHEIIDQTLYPISLGNFERMPNNSLQVIIGYFSFLSPLILLILLRSTPFFYWGALFGLLITNGAFFTPGIGVLLGLILRRL